MTDTTPETAPTQDDTDSPMRRRLLRRPSGLVLLLTFLVAAQAATIGYLIVERRQSDSEAVLAAQRVAQLETRTANAEELYGDSRTRLQTEVKRIDSQIYELREIARAATDAAYDAKTTAEQPRTVTVTSFDLTATQLCSKIEYWVVYSRLPRFDC